MNKFFLIASISIIFGICTPAHAATYTVTLKNGNAIEANSYRIEKGKVFLKYPVGEGAFNISQVASITVDGGSVNLLQGQGELKPADNKAAPAERKKSSLPFDPDAMKKRVSERMKKAREAAARQKAGDGPAGKMPFGGNSTPERDALIDQLDTADEAKRAEIEKKLFDDNIQETTTNQRSVGPRGGKN